MTGREPDGAIAVLARWASIACLGLVGWTLNTVNDHGKDISRIDENLRSLEYLVKAKLTESHSSLEKTQDRLVSSR